MHECMHACKHALMQACTHAHIQACTHAHTPSMHSYTHISMHSCTHTSMHSCMHTHILNYIREFLQQVMFTARFTKCVNTFTPRSHSRHHFRHFANDLGPQTHCDCHANKGLREWKVAASVRTHSKTFPAFHTVSHCCSRECSGYQVL